ncbi:hypothetical protein [Streptomyces cyslabdanicus]|uniref:hypothetical protein n=1 Tax=Streptomyces cyslabdanicus TaxID=1470456 RepID=UPI004043F99B
MEGILTVLALGGVAVFLVGAVGALIALVRALVMALPGRPRPWPAHLMRRAALTVGLAAAAIYALGLLDVALSEHEFGNGADSVPAPACRDGFDSEIRRHLTHHQPSYLPLGFDCFLDDGTVYSSNPNYGWMNWTSMSLALSGALLAVGARHLTDDRRAAA